MIFYLLLCASRLTKIIVEANSYLLNIETNHYIVIGDLNYYWALIKKKRISRDNLTRYYNFNKFIQNNNCIDLRYIGNPFIWHNKRKHENTIFCWLDHMLAIISGYICIIILFLKIFPYLDQTMFLFCLIFLCFLLIVITISLSFKLCDCSIVTSTT